MRNLLPVLNEADRRDQTESRRGPGRGCCQDAPRDQCSYGGITWTLVRLSWNQTGGYVSSCFSVARSPAEKGSLEGPADSHEGAGPARAGQGLRIRSAEIGVSFANLNSPAHTHI